MLPPSYNDIHQIMQTPDHVVIFTEMSTTIPRIIPLDGRPHIDERIRQFPATRAPLGGRYAVIETRNYAERRRYRGASGHMRVEERFTRVAEDRIHYEFTVDDPTTWTSRWSAEVPLVKTEGPRTSTAATRAITTSVTSSRSTAIWNGRRPRRPPRRIRSRPRSTANGLRRQSLRHRRPPAPPRNPERRRPGPFPRTPCPRRATSPIMNPVNAAARRPSILLTGATGCIGGRLLAALESDGHAVRCMTRRPAARETRVGPNTSVVRRLPRSGRAARAAGRDRDSLLSGPLAGRQPRFRGPGSRGGTPLRRCCPRRRRPPHRVRRGLGATAGLSRHLRSRHETGVVLRASGVPVIELRSGIVIGSGSLSFELIRALVERLPIMICPAWVRTPTQPIALDDLVAYLAAVLDLPHGDSRVFEVGGADVVSYGAIMREYARQRGLGRWLVPVPLLTPPVEPVARPDHAGLRARRPRARRRAPDGDRRQRRQHARRLSDSPARATGSHRTHASERGRRARGRALVRRRPVDGTALALGWRSRPRPAAVFAFPRSAPPRAAGSPPSARIGGATAGTTATGCGVCAVWPTACAAASACGGAGATASTGRRRHARLLACRRL